MIEVLENAVETYGVEIQSTVCMEECAELIQAISKCKRYGCAGKYRDNLIEEIADVMICADQLQIMYDVDISEIGEMIDKKIERLKERLKQHEESNVNH